MSFLNKLKRRNVLRVGAAYFALDKFVLEPTGKKVEIIAVNVDKVVNGFIPVISFYCISVCRRTFRLTILRL